MNYERIYNQIIQNRIINPLPESEYGQKHHIKPKSLYPELAKEPSNIVKLSYREHYICHWLLTKFMPCKEMIYAFWMMNYCKNSSYINSAGYVSAKNNLVELKKGSHMSTETKEKIRNSLLGKIPKNKGVPHSTEELQKMSLARKNKKWINNGVEHKYIDISNGIPDGYVLGRITHWIAESNSKRKWVTNGIDNKFIDISSGIPQGYYLGMTRKNHSSK